jgi:hypothetical protein
MPARHVGARVKIWRCIWADKELILVECAPETSINTIVRAAGLPPSDLERAVCRCISSSKGHACYVRADSGIEQAVKAARSRHPEWCPS